MINTRGEGRYNKLPDKMKNISRKNDFRFLIIDNVAGWVWGTILNSDHIKLVSVPNTLFNLCNGI